MTRLELAKLRFKQLAPALMSGADEAHSDQLEAWLRNDVVPVVEDLLDHPVYRRRVLEIPAQLFTSPAGNRRARINSCADGLVADAQTLVAVAREFGRAELLADQDRQQDEAWIAEQSAAGLDLRGTIEKLAERPWFDMVNPEDFWTPTLDLNLRCSDALLTRQFRRTHSQVELLGDHVIERMFARFDFWKQRLERTRWRLQQDLGKSTQPTYAALERMFRGAIDVEQNYQALGSDWRTGSEARLRNACLVLLHTYAAYHHVPQLPWLGGDLQARQGAALRSFFRHQGSVILTEKRNDGRLYQVGVQQASLVDVQLVRRVAAALEDVTALYDQGVHADDLIAEAKDQFRLVVVVRPRMVLWKGTLLELPWNGAEKTWNLLLHLAVKAEGKLPLHDFVLTGVESSRALSIRKSHLVEFLSRTAAGAELAVLVEKARGGDCRLNLEPSQIKVLDLDADQWTVDEREFLPANF